MASSRAVETEEAYLILYNLGWTDRKIAYAFRLTRAAVTSWRVANSLPRQTRPGLIDYDEASRLHEKGLSDARIARVLGVTASGVTRWRQRYGIPPNIDKPEVSVEQDRLIKRMLKEGGSAKAIGKAVGCCKATVQSRRSNDSASGLRSTGVTDACQRMRLSKDKTILDRIGDAIGRHLPSHIFEHASFDMYADLYEGCLGMDGISIAAPRYRSAAFKMCGSSYEHSRLDAENDDGLTLADTLSDPDWERPFGLED